MSIRQPADLAAVADKARCFIVEKWSQMQICHPTLAAVARDLTMQ